MKKIISIILVAMMLFSVMTVSVSAATYSESESNDSYSTADTLSLNNTINGSMGTSSDIDFYKITTSSNGKLSIRFNHNYVDNSSVYWNVYIYYYTDGQLKELSNKRVYGTSNESISFPVIGAVSSGTYYVKVTTYYNSTTEYKYSVSNGFTSTSYYEREFNNSYSIATPLSLNKTYSGYMNSSDDSDFYKINTSSNGKLSIVFNHTYVDDSSVYWNVYIYRYVDGSYTELSYKRVYGTSNESISFPVIGTVSSGTYYVKVTTYYDSTTDYEYSVSNSFVSTDYYEKELNNSYSAATSISLNNTYSGYMNSSDDSDFYKLSLSSSSTVTFYFNHSYVNDSSVYWNVYVYNYSGGAYNEIANKRIYGYDSESYTLFGNKALSSGTYYVKITTYYDSTSECEYSIKFSSSSSTTTYTLSYNANGGSGAPSSQTGKTTYTISSTIPTRSGYTFLGWSKSSSATSATYDAGDKITLTSNTTLYAVWKKNSTAKPTITLSDSRINVKVGESVTVVANCNKNGSDVRRTVNYSIKNTSVVSAEWIEWQGDDAYLKIHGISEGTTTVTITLTNTDTKEVYDIAEITVNVIDENNSGNGNTSTSGEFSFMDILNAIAGFFTWLFSAIASLFA